MIGAKPPSYIKKLKHMTLDSIYNYDHAVGVPNVHIKQTNTSLHL